MASNPYVNKVQLANGTTLMDISDTTATASDVAEGKYFYAASGAKVLGTSSGGGGSSGVEIKDSTKTGVDLDISDDNGNVILRLADGHIQTKEFDSSNVSGNVSDVQFNGTSIVQNGIANIQKAADDAIKAGANQYQPIVPSNQNVSVFYGLAKLAGADMASSSNAVGTYTDAAKVAIQKMLGIYQAPWELIREDTVTNETAGEHIITLDGNGQPFELTDAVLQVTIPKDIAISIGSYGIIEFYKDSSTYETAMLGAVSGTKTAAWYGCAMFFTSGKAVHILNTQYSESGNNRNIQTRNQNEMMLKPVEWTVVKIRFRNIQGTIGYKLYGRRKWE